MSTLLSRLRTLFGGQQCPAHTFTKVAIIGEYGVGKLVLLQHLSDPPISRYMPDINLSAGCHIGSNHQLGFDFVAVDLGTNASRRWIEANASLYRDADALIIAVDFFNPEELEELRYHLNLSVNGRDETGRIDFYPTVKKGIPWVVLVNFKAESMNEHKAREQVNSLKLDDLGVNWIFRPIATATGEGIDEAVPGFGRNLMLLPLVKDKL